MFRKLRSLDEAKRILKQNFTPKPVGVEQVPLSLAHNRVLAENVVAPIDVPPFNRSTMDGYAVKAADTFGAEEDRPIALKLCGSVRVGETPKVTVEKGTTVEIVTGAPLPNGANAVVMLEYVVQKNNTVFTHRSVSKGENVMKVGSDIHKGEVILKKSQTLSSREIGVLAALGFAQV
ncbi:molybdopterin biosynthesis protein, partial [Candidatus Bathyarchaeota archaeon]|nr:molybdopterin biosynthesis protein [Candidatus Bathyarchaeota archaeon]